MKISWFGGACFRLYVGGRIYVSKSDQFPSGAKVNAREIEAGADQIVNLDESGLADFPSEQWTPRHPVRLVDDGPDSPADIYAFGASGLVIDDSKDPTLILTTEANADWGRFAEDAVIILCGEESAAAAVRLFSVAQPKLLALALADFKHQQLQEIGHHSGRTPVQILERGMALEV